MDPFSIALGAGSLGASIFGGMSASRAAKKQQEELKKQLAERESKISSIYDRMGMAGKASIDRSTQNALGAATSSAIDRGLGNSTVLDTLQGQARESGLLAQLQLQDQIASGKANALSQIPIAVPEKPQGGGMGDMFKMGLQGLQTVFDGIGAPKNQTQDALGKLGGQETQTLNQPQQAPAFNLPYADRSGALAGSPTAGAKRSGIAGSRPSWSSVIGRGGRNMRGF
jgi:hypothetical protein